MSDILQKEKWAIISEETPLLTELSALDNISLMLKYHFNMSVNKAEKYVCELMKRVELENLCYKRPYALSKIDKAFVQYIRAYVSPFDKIAIIKPFSMLDKIEHLEMIIDLSQKLNDKKIKIFDTDIHGYYKGERCHIIK